MISNFERRQKIINQAYAENFSCLFHVEPRNLPRSLYLWPRWSGPFDAKHYNTQESDDEKWDSFFYFFFSLENGYCTTYIFFSIGCLKSAEIFCLILQLVHIYFLNNIVKFSSHCDGRKAEEQQAVPLKGERRTKGESRFDLQHGSQLI